jgi:uncharacterized SAM-dependent methyltransferase
MSNRSAAMRSFHADLGQNAERWRRYLFRDNGRFGKPDYVENFAFSMGLREMFEVAQNEACARFGHLSKYMYAGPEFPHDPVNGAEGFNTLCLHPHYYMLSAEADIIRAHPGFISDFLSDRHALAELGIGPQKSIEGKTEKILELWIEGALKHNDRRLNKHGGKTMDMDLAMAFLAVLQFTIIEISQHYLNNGADYLAEKFNLQNAPLTDPAKLFIFKKHTDFADIGNTFADVANLAFLLLGNTQANQRTATGDGISPWALNPGVMDFLKNKIGGIKTKNRAKILIGQDCNENVRSLLDAYFNCIAERWMKNLLHRMERDGGVKFATPVLDADASNWEYFARWNKETFCMEMGVRNIRPQTVIQTIGKETRSYRLKAGTELHMWNSHKFPREVFTWMLGVMGFEVERVLTNPRDKLKRMGIFACWMPHRAPG